MQPEFQLGALIVTALGLASGLGYIIKSLIAIGRQMNRLDQLERRTDELEDDLRSLTLGLRRRGKLEARRMGLVVEDDDADG